MATKNNKQTTVLNSGILIDRNFDDIIAEGFNRYAKYIIQDRALPELKDGLKPVQRRILFAMYKLGLTPTSQFKKAARTVGDVLGKYHPHGDSSIYEALIRMAQDWKNNLPEIEVHGNKGSIDDDPPAAMRYTEARLSHYGQALLSDIDKKIYPFIDNFDDTETEPTLLSSLLPNLLINGASGIAAGYATSIPTFNITELLNAIIATIQNPQITLEEILTTMPGPDFPTGGILTNYDEIKKFYTTGEGKITICAAHHFVASTKKEKAKIVITSVPYETVKSEIVKQIEDLRADNKLPNVLSVIDATDKNGIAIELELSNSTVNVEQIMAFLYKKTQLQVNFAANMVVINDRKPIKIGVLQYIQLYIQHAIETIIRVQKYLLNEDLERYEVVQGLIKAISILDVIISLIRKSKDKTDSIQNLMQQFAFTKNQAEAIVSLRLYRLSNTDISLLEQEQKDLQISIKEHEYIIQNKAAQNGYLIETLKKYILEFGYNRRCIIQKNKVINTNTTEKDLLQDKDVMVVITNTNQAKYVNNLTFESEKINGINFKNSNDFVKFSLKSNLKSSLLFFTNLGRFVSLDTFKLPEGKWKDNGLDLNNKLHLLANENIVAVFDCKQLKQNQNKHFCFATSGGKIKRVNKEEFIKDKELRLATCIKLEENDYLIDVVCCNDINNDLYLFSKKGYCLKFAATLVPTFSNKAKGVIGMKLTKNDEIVKLLCVNELNTAIGIFANNYFKIFKNEDFKATNRNNVGTDLLNSKTKQTLINVLVLKNHLHLLGINEQNQSLSLDHYLKKETTNWCSLNTNLKAVLIYEQ